MEYLSENALLEVRPDAMFGTGVRVSEAGATPVFTI